MKSFISAIILVDYLIIQKLHKDGTFNFTLQKFHKCTWFGKKLNAMYIFCLSHIYC